MNYSLAPMEGITGYIFRSAYHEAYPGISRYYTPFLSPVMGRKLTTRDLNEVLPENNRNIPLVPQVLTRCVDDLLWAADLLGEMGYGEMNLNLGCPSPTVVSKRKGAAFLAEPDELDRFFEQFFVRNPGMRLSVKTRLGMKDEAEFDRILTIYNRYPLTELIIHPRVQADLYKRPTHPQAFARALSASRAPVCYNGDLFSREQVLHLGSCFPGLSCAMLGRGLLAFPGILQEGLPDREKLRGFHDRLMQQYLDRLDAHNMLHRMKELWFYLRYSFEQPEKSYKQIRKANTHRDYVIAVNSLFDSLDLCPSPCFIAP